MQPKCSTLYSRQTADRRPFTLAGFLVAVAFLMFVGSASAQSLPGATALGSAGISVPPSQPASGSEAQPESAPLAPAPAYCSPCLYYSGDLDPAVGGDGLTNENDTVVSPSQVFTPFAVPSGHIWTITGVLINTVTVGGSVHLPKKAGWSIWKGTASGVGGTLLFAGANQAAFTLTGRTLGGGLIPEYTAKVTLPQPIALGAGTYFLNVMPQCTNPISCSGQRFFESNVTDALPVHHHGPANITNGSFINSGFFGADYADPNGFGTFNLFSFGIVGTCVTSGGSACSF